MKKVIVTGGTGFIGSNIAIALLNKGYNVKIIDDNSTGKIENIKSVRDKVEFSEGSITDLEFLKKEFAGFDCVLHQAALPSVPRSIQDPISSNNVNINGTLNVLMAAKENNVGRVVFASSSSIYGDKGTGPKKEDMMPNPLSPYALTKLTGEYYCNIFYKIFGLKTVCLRYFNVFGPRQDPNSQYSAVIPLFIKAVLNDKSPIIYGDGLQTRDFNYVGDVINANILAMNAEKGFGEVFNIASGGRITILDLLKKINEECSKEIEPEHQEPRAGDIKHSLADISKAQETLGYDIEYGFEEGLRKTIDWYKNESK